MNATALSEHEPRTWALIFAKGDEVIRELTAFAKQHQLAGAHFTAIGAFSEATLGFFDRARKDYTKIQVREQVEVLSLVGDVARQDGEPKAHAHVVVGKRDGSAHGGHLLDARVWPTLELMLTESSRVLARVSDRESGLALIDLKATRERPAA